MLDHGIAPAPLDAESLAVIERLGFRRLRAVLGAALAGALEDGRDWPSAADLHAAADLLGPEASHPAERAPAGFIKF